MRMSKQFSRTLREAPSHTESASYKYLVRAGFIHQLGAGIFNLLPLGYRAIRNIEAIIRDEMEGIGAQEILMPVVNPSEVWKETGRYYAIDKEMGRFEDRTGREMVLAMTHEEVVTDIARFEIDSYKRLPQLVYHLQTKWRDDPRPRAGLIRVREFTMKDSYSFDRDYEGLEKQYKAHYSAYFRIFDRCHLPSIAVGSDTGMMGGKVAHEYMYLSSIGEDTIIICPECDYTANRQIAVSQKEFFPEEVKPKEEVHTPGVTTIEELAQFLDLPERKMAKALFMMGTFVDETTGEERQQLIMGLIRGDLDIEENKLQNAAKAHALRPAHPDEIADANIVSGFGGPIGCDPSVMIIVDQSVAQSNNLVSGANKKDYHYLNTNFDVDYSGAMYDIASVREGQKCLHCNTPLTQSKGIEIGNIFQLGTRYSEAMGAMYQDEEGHRKPVIMGSYGIGVGRLLACLAEEHHDDKGLMLPISVAPYQVHLVSLLKEGELAESIYSELEKRGIEVLYDDRKESAGVKFADADLIGLPIRVTLGNRSVKEGTAEVKLRRDLETTHTIALDSLCDDIETMVQDLHNEILKEMVAKELP
ncbi:MAG: proline--tRNA ligase [Sphaerochaetaceae bacterium]|jgi:prolyl-tRNA synthetase